jgi:acetylornithine deacetylase/succinyl-diaminopimelate desuccinylase-like protein
MGITTCSRPSRWSLWKTPPFEPRIENGKIFGRGASDDKGQTFAHLNAIEAFLKTRGALPVNVKVLIEGEEEIGSPKFTPFVEDQSELLACDCVAISDTSMWAEGAPALCYALRGLVAAEVEIEGPCRDLHSGSFGGAGPQSHHCSLPAPGAPSRLGQPDRRPGVL